jgi:hypothetical protein
MYSKYHLETNKHDEIQTWEEFINIPVKKDKLELNYNKLREVIKISWIDKIFSLIDLTLVKFAL